MLGEERLRRNKPMFKDVENHEHYYKVKENGKYGIGIYPVLYGFRVRIWEVTNNINCICDLCFGDNPSSVSTGYTVVKQFIERGGDPKDIPLQSKKPWVIDNVVNDVSMFNRWMLTQIRSEYDDREFIDISPESLQKYRQQQFSKVGL